MCCGIKVYEIYWVYHSVIFYHLIVKVIACTQACTAHKTDNITFRDHRTLASVNMRKMRITCLETEAVCYNNRFAITGHIAGKGNRAIGCGMYSGRILSRHVKPGMKGTFTADRMHPISEPVGYAVILFKRCHRRYKPENILLTAYNMPHGSDLFKITCSLQHLCHQCALILCCGSRKRKQHNQSHAKAPTHLRYRCSPGQKEHDGHRFFRLSRYGKTCHQE